jgi:ubiquitin-conjugating enzyme E2 D/E
MTSENTRTQRQARRRLEKELTALRHSPIDGCTAQPSPSDIFSWTATINGPPDTVFAGGVFHLSLLYPPNYPFQPPKVTFVTKIYHPNIDSGTGFVGLSILKEEWCPVLTVSKILLSLRAFLGSPDPGVGVAVMKEIAEECRERMGVYEETAREWTGRFARGGG